MNSEDKKIIKGLVILEIVTFKRNGIGDDQGQDEEQ